MKKMKRKAQAFTLGDLGSIAIALVVAALILGLGATILASVQSGQSSGTAAYNASGYGLTGINTLASYVPTIALVADAQAETVV